MDADSKLDDNSEKVISTNFITYSFAIEYLYSNYDYRPFFDVTEFSIQQYFVDNKKYTFSYNRYSLVIESEGTTLKDYN